MCGYPGAFYHIGGEVKYPGEKIFEDQTLTHAILGAGGFTACANKRKVRVISRDGQWRVIDCSRMEGVVGGRSRQEDVKLLHRDFIYVPRVSKWPFW
jgi:protein involved in polysaccharide export with SLBB domain